MVYLGKGRCQFPAPRAGTGNDYQGFFRFNIFIGAITLIADDQVDIRWISFGILMSIYLYSSAFQFVFKLDGRRLILKTGNHHSQHIDSPPSYIVDEFEGIGIIGNAEISPDFFPFNIAGINTE